MKPDPEIRGPASDHAAAAIVLLTDFGGSDWYVAEMKGVLLARAPGIPLVDFTHDIPPGDVDRAAFLLARGHRAFPGGTVFLVVVDPGVGTARRALAVHSGGRYYVGPDNGVLEAALDGAGAAVRAIEDAELIAVASETFHGRDVFAPVAARIALAGTTAWHAVGPPVTDPVRLTDHARPAGLDALQRAAEGGRLTGRVVHVDRFGNAITDIPEVELEAWLGDRDPAGLVISARGARPCEVRGLATTYDPPTANADLESGADSVCEAPAPIALVGSSGLVEVAVPGAHAGLRLGLAPGDPVEVWFEESF
jgi:S-adenosylmethionine hydrolase